MVGVLINIFPVNVNPTVLANEIFLHNVQTVYCRCKQACVEIYLNTYSSEVHTWLLHRLLVLFKNFYFQI